MKIVLVEDDHNQRSEIKKALESRYPDSVVETYPTESAFLSAVPGMATNPPDIAIVDMMVKWTNPGPDMTLPPPTADFLDAGFRCVDELHRAYPDIPVVLYTVLDRSDLDPSKVDRLPKRVRYVSKRSHVDAFYDAIEALTRLVRSS